MSYEVYNRLWGKSADDLLAGQGRGDLERMADRLEEIGGEGLARETREFVGFLSGLEEEVERRADRLRLIWRAVDGFDSADWDKVLLQEALSEYQASLQPSSEGEGLADRRRGR